jgi:hypothetical protein
MSTNRTFDSMLNEYLTYPLLQEEMKKRSYLYQRVEKDDGWAGGTLIVPFKAAGATSIAFGSLSAATDIAEDKYVRGSVSGYKELWGSMIWNQRDIYEHDGRPKEKTFLGKLMDSVKDFMDYMKEVISINMLNGAHFATLTADGTAGGLATVDRPERFHVNQKVIVDDDNSAPATGYVSAVDINTNIVTLVTTRGGVTALDISAYTVAQNARTYHDGAQAESFTGLKSSLLSAANGGSATLYGVSKVLYPYLQAINVSGSGVTAANVLTQIFDAFTRIRTVGKGNPNEVLMSFKHLGSILKSLETTKGPYNVTPGSMKAEPFGWTTVEITGVQGSLKVVAIQELDNDVMMFMDWSSLKLHSNGGFRKRIAPDGKQYFEVRSTSGFQYITDLSFFGELILNRPSYCGILHSIPNY